MTRAIPGKLDAHALALLSGPRDPAQVNRPADPASLAREARSLLSLGLSVVDAAQALSMPAPALADLLQRHLEETP